MKIDEITDKNLVWKNLVEINLEFEDEFVIVEKYASSVLSTKHISRYPVALSLIHAFVDRAIEFLNSKPFDPNDSEIIELQQQVRNMVVCLTELEKKLK